MDNTNESVAPENQDNVQNKSEEEIVSSAQAMSAPEKKPSSAVTLAEAIAAREKAATASKKTATMRTKREVGPKMQNSETVQMQHDSIEQNLDKLEEKITRNLDQFKTIGKKIMETEEEIEEIKVTKQTFREKVKKALYFAPKVCVEANVCRFPKAMCKTCRKIADVSISVGSKGLKNLGTFSVKCADTLTTGLQLPMIRMKINKKFKKLGDGVYQMYLGDKKNILENDDIKKCIDAVKAYEKEIETLEARLQKENTGPIVQGQGV